MSVVIRPVTARRMNLPLTVVVIESQHAIRKMICGFLNELGDVQVIGEASDCLNGINYVKELKPAILFTDIPERSGIDLVEQACKAWPAPRVVVFTANTNPELFRMARQAGAAAYLLKRSRPEEIAIALRSVIAGRVYITPEMNSCGIDSQPEADLAYNRLLTPRQRQTLHAIADGRSSKEIAQLLSVSPKTVDHHRSDLMRKLGAHCVADLVRIAFKTGLID